MIKSSHNIFVVRFFDWYIKRQIRKYFFRVETEFWDASSLKFTPKTLETAVDPVKPILVLQNHFSWWDGFIMQYLNIHHFGKRFHFMMLEEELRQRWLFSYAGGYSVKKGSRSIVESLAYTKELLCDRQNLVLMFPQGKIESQYLEAGEIRFEKGVQRLLRNGREFQTLLAVVLTDYFSRPKPTLYVYLSPFQEKAENVEAAYRTFYRTCRSRQLTKAGL